MENKSGIFPRGDRILVKPEEIEEKTAGGIVIPETIKDQHSMAQSIGILVAVGPDAWTHYVERSTRGMEQTVVRRGYSEPFAKVGDRVLFARYGGVQLNGKDGEKYRLLNDDDVTALVDPEVVVSDLKGRSAMHERK